jgi:hypothetical protein
MYAKFKSYLTPSSSFNVNVKGKKKRILFINWVYSSFDGDVIEALMADDKFDKYYGVEKETLDISNEEVVDAPLMFNIYAPSAEEEEEEPSGAIVFRTVPEAKEWLKEKFNAPSAINTVSKCVEFGKLHGVKIEFNRD